MAIIRAFQNENTILTLSLCLPPPPLLNLSRFTHHPNSLQLPLLNIYLAPFPFFPLLWFFPFSSVLSKFNFSSSQFLLCSLFFYWNLTFSIPRSSSVLFFFIKVFFPSSRFLIHLFFLEHYSYFFFILLLFSLHSTILLLPFFLLPFLSVLHLYS